MDPTSHRTNSGSDLLDLPVCIHFTLYLYRGGFAVRLECKMDAHWWIQQVTTRVGAVTCWIQQPVSPKQVVGFTCVFNSEVDQLMVVGNSRTPKIVGPFFMLGYAVCARPRGVRLGRSAGRPAADVRLNARPNARPDVRLDGRRRRLCRQRRRKKKHLIEAAPFGRLDQM